MTFLIKNVTLAELAERLETFEKEFGLSSEEFFRLCMHDYNCLLPPTGTSTQNILLR